MQPIRSNRRWGNRRRRQEPLVYRPRGFLLTKNEAAFFRVLTTVIADCYQISCKVRLADIVTCDDEDWQRGHANRISQKHIDFVVNCAESSRIVAAIELDDSSHERPERRDRDAFVNQLFWQMGLRLIRVPAQWEYDADRIAGRLVKAGLQVKCGRIYRVDDRAGGNRGRASEKSYRWSFGVAQSPKASSVGRRRF